MSNRAFLLRSRNRLLNVFSRSRSLLRSWHFLGLRSLLVEVTASRNVAQKVANE